MKFFVDASHKPKADKSLFKQTPSYIEVQLHRKGLGFINYVYIFLWRRNSFLIVSPIQAKPLLDILNQQLQDPKLGTTYYKIYKQTWPQLIDVLDNTVNDRYSKGVLLNMEDPDDAERKWVIGTVIGNIALNTDEDLDSAIRSDRMKQAYILVLTLCENVVSEIAKRKISTLSYMQAGAMGAFRGAIGGYKKGLDLACMWLPKI